MPALPTHSPPPALTRWLALLLAVQLVGVGYVVWFFITEGYLPSPFVYDKADTFMDFFHPLYWAGDEGRYTVWQSVYPPLNFVFLKLVAYFFLQGETFANGFAIRAAYPALQWFIIAMALASAALAFLLGPMRGWHKRDQVLLFLFFILSPPFLFAVERGNLILLSLPFLALVLTRTGLVRMVAIAVLINLKPYFVVLTLLYLARRQFDWFILTGLCAAFIFLTTGLLIDVEFLMFFANLFGFSQSETIFSGREILAMPSSISAFAYVASIALNGSLDVGMFYSLILYPATLLGSFNLIVLIACITIIIAVSPKLDSAFIMIFSIALIPNLGYWVGGYSLMFLLFIIPYVLYLRFGSLLVTIIFLLFSPLDLMVLHRDPVAYQNVFLSSEIYLIVHDFGLGSMIRPILDFLLLVLSTYALIGRVQSVRSPQILFTLTST